MLLFDPVFELADKRDQVGIEEAAHIAQFDCIDASGTTLNVTDERLAANELVGQGLLRDASTGARLADQGARRFIASSIRFCG